MHKLAFVLSKYLDLIFLSDYKPFFLRKLTQSAIFIKLATKIPFKTL